MASKIDVLYNKSSWSPARSQSIPWDTWIHLVRLFKAQNETWIPSDLTRRVLRIEDLRNSGHRGRNTLTVLLEESNDCFCSNWVDKIYALIGIAADCISGCLGVNYTQPRLELYSELMSRQSARVSSEQWTSSQRDCYGRASHAERSRPTNNGLIAHLPLILARRHIGLNRVILAVIPSLLL